LPLYIRALIEDGVIDWPAMLAMMTINPARLVGVAGHGLGSLEVGETADITIIDPQMSWRIDPSEFASVGRNCPFRGWNVKGRAVAAMVGGRLKMLRMAQRATQTV
jgi:dihydroorotase